MRLPPKNTGYVLLMTLLLITIVAVAIASVSRLSLQRSIQTSREADKLQRNWAMRSAQYTIMQQANELLEKAEEDTAKPVGRLQFELKLGEQLFAFELADEQAKFNINSSFDLRGRVQTSESVRLLTANCPNKLVLLKPAISTPGMQNNNMRSKSTKFTLFSQVFHNVQPEHFVMQNSEREGLSSYVSCWGNGKTNFLRASREVLILACQPYLNSSEIDQLIQLREEIPGISLSQALGELDLSKNSKKMAMKLLTDRSGTFSLWSIHNAGTRVWYEFIVQSTSSHGNAGEKHHLIAW